MWVLLPVVRALARLAPGSGGPLLGAVLLRCLAPDWVLLRPRPPARQLAWAEEAVAVHRAYPRDPDRLSRALAVHAQTLLAVGRYTEACAAADASAAVPGADPSPAETAHLLHVRAQALLEQGGAEEALEAARSCVAAYRRGPAPAGRDRSLGSLPGALRTYALVLGELGHTEQSVLVYEECAGLLRSMSFRESARFLLVLPRVLVELVGGLRTLGRYEEALALGPEARESLGGGVAFAYPVIVPPLRIRLLVDLAGCRDATGDRAGARDTAEEAVDAACAWTTRNQSQGIRWQGVTLSCLAGILGEMDAPDEELSTREQLVAVYMFLASEEPDPYDPLLGEAFDDLARCHRRAGDHTEAVVATRHGVEAYRRAVARDAAHEPELARALANLSIRQDDAGDAESAVTSAREALALTRRLAESDWQTYHPLTARRLHVLGQALQATGDVTKTVSCYEEAEAVLEEHRDRPGADADLARIRDVLSDALLARVVVDDLDAKVADLRSLLDLADRADTDYVHAKCFRAFNLARSDEVARAWQSATGEPYPGSVYPFRTDRGRGSNPAAR
ncbi:tetratricopeptide repeat protein [Streptomyces sp. S3(2020)]|uniref:tetratricopeptide repeat protein n=1 Tax=Streptomyces sp. S3(2020) TaxID=2732044 RepID=UPI001487F0A4|nr:tetratricopeptide repeat protein [Streptomyces sp. S3(2020)]NNN33885.1 tetratricopeptide repeat protein [Streptomyces sp. S3(2020)]